MSDVAEAAGVSRATIYRYFSGRDAVLDCMGGQVRCHWERSLRESLRAEPEPEHRVRVVTESLYSIHDVVPEAKVILEHDPDFVISYVQRHFTEYVQTVGWALAPMLDSVAAVHAGVVTRADVAEILMWICVSDELVLREPTMDTAQRVDAFWALVGGRAADAVVPMGEASSAPEPGLRLFPRLISG